MLGPVLVWRKHWSVSNCSRQQGRTSVWTAHAALCLLYTYKNSAKHAKKILQSYEISATGAVFLEAPESVEEMRAFCAAAPNTPKMANIIEGGRTPALPPAELDKLGFKFAIYSVTLLSAAVGAMNRALADLRAGRPAAGVIPFGELCETVGFGHYTAEATRYALDPPPPPAQLSPLSPVRRRPS